MTGNRAATTWTRAGIAFSAGVVFLAAQLGGQIAAGHNPLFSLRTLYWHDQLGYLAIAANVVSGDFDSSEPLTRTGVSHYPRFYYSLVGVVARVADLSAVTAWNITGLAFQFAAVVTLSVVLCVISRRWWMGLLAPLPFMTGTLSVVMGQGWYTQLEAHAVLWGPYGALFSKNAEGAGLSIGVTVIALLMWVWTSPVRPITRWSVTIACSSATGALAAFQTYSFLTVTYVLVFTCAAAAIAASRTRILVSSVSVVLLVATWVVGPAVSDQAGQLPTLIFGLLPALPGVFAAIVRSRGLIAAAGVAAAACAAPQIMWTVSGILSEDPFLVYRVASNHDLGVVDARSLVAALPVLVPLVGALVVAFATRDIPVIAASGGSLVALVSLALNDLWGANAEPYRFWINGFLIGGVVATLSWARLVRRRGRPAVDRSDVRDGIRTSDRRFRRVRLASTMILVTSGVLFIAGLADLAAYTSNREVQDSWNPHTPREDAIGELARRALAESPEDLLLPEPCIDARTTKALSGAAISYYHLGMAWPENKVAIDDVMDALFSGAMDIDAMRDADVGWVLTDSACPAQWGQTYASDLMLETEMPYPGGVVSLWRVRS